MTKALLSDSLTQGPAVRDFERKFAERIGAVNAVAVSSGTAALHSALHAVGIGPGDEIIVPTLTFVATPNSVLYTGATPVFVDVDPDTLLIDVEDVQRKFTDKTKAIIPVDFAGQSADYESLQAFASEKYIIADCCHSTGEEAIKYADATCHSFHPVKHLTTGEGGMVATDDPDIAQRVREFRNHGRDNGLMHILGYNYRMPDINAAIGSSQLDRLDDFIARRQEIAGRYDEAFAGTDVRPLARLRDHSYHLYVIRVENRDGLKNHLAGHGIETQIHYYPSHLQPYYLRNLHTKPGDCPNAEQAFKEILSIPCHPSLKDSEQELVIEKIRGYFNGN